MRVPVGAGRDWLPGVRVLEGGFVGGWREGTVCEDWCVG